MNEIINSFHLSILMYRRKFIIIVHNRKKLKTMTKKAVFLTVLLSRNTILLRLIEEFL
jgi:hypothetical protein